MKLATDTGIVFARELRPTLRNPFSLAVALAQPVVFLGLFGPLVFGSTGESLQWFVPGVLVMLGMFGTSATGANLLFEMQTGAHERMLVTPLTRSSLLIGRALKELFPILVQALLIVLLTVPFGFRPDPFGTPVALLILAVFGTGLGALSYAGVDVLGGAAVAAVPVDDHGRDDAPARRRAGLAARGVERQPADVRGGGAARALRGRRDGPHRGRRNGGRAADGAGRPGGGDPRHAPQRRLTDTTDTAASILQLWRGHRRA
jgi:hypothetical protein